MPIANFNWQFKEQGIGRIHFSFPLQNIHATLQVHSFGPKKIFPIHEING